MARAIAVLSALAACTGCAAPLFNRPLASKVDKAVEAAAADNSFPTAAEAGLAAADT